MTFRLSRFESPLIEDDGENCASLLGYSPENELYTDVDENHESWFRRFLSFITSSPYDMFLIINEHVESIDWDSKASTIAGPLGNFFTCSLYTARLLQDSLIKPNHQKLGKKRDSFDLSRSEVLRKFEYLSQVPKNSVVVNHLNWYWNFLTFLNVALRMSVGLLVLLNLFVAYKFLMGRFQVYSLFYTKTRPRSKNVIERPLSDLGFKSFEEVTNSSLWTMIRYMFVRKRSVTKDLSNGKRYYQLRKWTPGKFYTALFSTFSPISVIFLLVTEVSFKTALAVFGHQYILFLVLFKRYESRLDDEACLAKAHFEEINEKVIKPRTTIKTQDAMVDATTYGGGAAFFPSFTTTRSHIFQTHAVTGDIITERYNPETRNFEDVEDCGRAKNYISQGQGVSQSQQVVSRSKAINGATARPQFFSRQPSPNKVGTPSNMLGHRTSPFSAPTTPTLKPVNGIQNGLSFYRNSPDPSKVNSLIRDTSHLSRNNTLSRLRRNSVSPTKSGGYCSAAGMRSVHKSNFGADSSISYSVEAPSYEAQFEEVARRGRHPFESAVSRDLPAGRSSALSSRHSSVSPLKGNSSFAGRESKDSRPPFR
ncbi:LAQU0S02e00452g1_1 [Lachancea quebecensis]|uniref:Nuclear rim protein 1 n=1 Tax=Lachancea quebecensis TaxID=1654605 RepID=A0A0P1KMB1_9SACH|nr:LAQU0S02e00452g1_1 [Lachancea quebecensis]